MKQSLKSDSQVMAALPQNVFLEKMKNEELERVLHIETELFGKDAWSREMFEHDLALDYAKYWSLKIKRECDSSLEIECESDSPSEFEVIGYAGIYFISPEVEISNVAISKEFQGRGYSNLLMKKILQECERSQTQFVFLEVDVSNRAAIGLYEKYFFEKVGIRKNYYGIGKDAFVMKLEL